MLSIHGSVVSPLLDMPRSSAPWRSEYEIDFVTLSYCRSPADVEEARGFLTSIGKEGIKVRWSRSRLRRPPALAGAWRREPQAAGAWRQRDALLGSWRGEHGRVASSLQCRLLLAQKGGRCWLGKGGGEESVGVWERLRSDAGRQGWVDGSARSWGHVLCSGFSAKAS
jgi:hypothetical protein